MIAHVVQVFPQKDYTVFIYFADGKIKKYDVKPLLDKGVFKRLQDMSIFLDRCTVMNNTLAWDLSGTYDPYTCIDLDPDVLYDEGKEVSDPLNTLA